jgi:uncharacterized protein
MQQTILVERNVPMRMRDGITLRADIYRVSDGIKKPVILARTPYGKGFSENAFALFAAEQGYIVILQDTRGRWASEGEGYPFIHEKQDGYDTIAWAKKQPWCNGRIGMFGMSYLGYTQFAAACLQPPGLQAIIPNMTFSDLHSLLYVGGALALGTALSWSIMAGAHMAIFREPVTESQKQPLWGNFVQTVNQLSARNLFSHLPLDEIPLVGKGEIAPFFADYIHKRDDSAFWQATACPLADIAVPALHIGGWYDTLITHTLNSYASLVALRRMPQKLLIGPWSHGSYDGLVGEVDFGLQSSGMMVFPEEMILHWFDYWLKDDDNGLLDEPPVRIFVMGENIWRSEAEWPLRRTEYSKYYLHSNGAANSLYGNGTLSTQSPGEEPVDTFVYDPLNPVPTRGGGLCCWNPALAPGAYDQHSLEKRQDVLVYTTPPLEYDLEVTGSLVVKLWAASSAIDTDFTAKLVDVSPCGYARNIQDGIQRARYRNPEKEELLKPGEVVLFTINLSATSNVFKSGHRVRLEISSSNFPRFDRNANIGQAAKSISDLKPALQTIFHNSNYPSHIKLPVIPR